MQPREDSGNLFPILQVGRPELPDQQLLFMVGSQNEVQAHEGEEGEQIDAHGGRKPHHQHAGEVHGMAAQPVQPVGCQGVPVG